VRSCRLQKVRFGLTERLLFTMMVGNCHHLTTPF